LSTTGATCSGSPAISRLLIRGLLAGLLAFAFAKLFSEPQIDKAIAYEEARGPRVTPEVSREVQSTVGLLLGTAETELSPRSAPSSR
jgi:hypothetical protein